MRWLIIVPLLWIAAAYAASWIADPVVRSLGGF